MRCARRPPTFLEASELPRRSRTTIPANKKLHERQIEARDNQANVLVYELYGLTEEEITIVEAAAA
jgi:hypothetical protein